MKYSKEQVLDIIKFAGNEYPDELFDMWCINDSNKLLDLGVGFMEYKTFVYDFPIIVDGIDVAKFTLVRCCYTGYDNDIDSLMCKYFGYELFELTERSYTNEFTYNCGYLTITNEISLPEIVEGFYGQESSFKDKSGCDIRYFISYGYPNDDKLLYSYNGQYKIFVDDKTFDDYRFGNEIIIQIEKKKFDGYMLGEKINMNINERVLNKFVG